MSDDIVTRLRICRLETTTGDLCVEAADEIERLREQNDYLKALRGIDEEGFYE